MKVIWRFDLTSKFMINIEYSFLNHFNSFHQNFIRIALSCKITTCRKQFSHDTAVAAAWSTLIGREMSRLGSHWSRVLLAPALLCHKEPARRIQSPLLGALERKIPLGGYFACSSLVLYGIRDRWLPCTERSYYRRPYAIKNQRGASKIPQVGGILRSKAFFMA